MKNELAPTSTTPAAAYEECRAAQQAIADVEAAICERYGSTRALVFFVGFPLAFLANKMFTLEGAAQNIPPLLFAGLAGCFGYLVWRHNQHKERQADALRLVALYDRGLARLAGDWAGCGSEGAEYVPDDHLYAHDLDIFGKGSLFQYLSIARTTLGEAQLADWLQVPAEPDDIRARQAAVAELRERLDLREDLARLGGDLHETLDPSRLREWSQEPPALAGHDRAVFMARILSACGAGAVVVAILSIWGNYPGYVGLVLVYCANFVYLNRTARLLHTITAPLSGISRHVERLSQMLAISERQNFTAPRLRQIRKKLQVEGLLPSEQILRLQRFIDSFFSMMSNAFMLPVSLLFLMQVQHAFRIEAWRRDIGEHLPDWLSGVGEFEALLSLANYAYENPAHAVPTITDPKDGPHFSAVSLGHPLLSPKECVRNDLSLDKQTAIILISGSNMSGKSTLLRAAGTNIVLALAGAPVRAESFSVSPLAIGASIQIHDSLLDGQSHFYAEIARLRAVVSLLDGELPLFFLLDEILHGTNSHDRTIGASKVLLQIVERGGVGLVTTHDLALTKVVDDTNGRGKNMHFQDEMIDERMVFDYTIREGVVTKSNALALMRAVGLDV